MTRVAVQVTPRASGNAVELLDYATLRVRVTASPVDGAANQAVVRVLADALGVARSTIEIVSGTTGRRKIVDVSGLSLAELARRLRP